MMKIVEKIVQDPELRKEVFESNDSSRDSLTSSRDIAFVNTILSESSIPNNLSLQQQRLQQQRRQFHQQQQQQQQQINLNQIKKEIQSIGKHFNNNLKQINEFKKTMESATFNNQPTTISDKEKTKFPSISSTAYQCPEEYKSMNLLNNNVKIIYHPDQNYLNSSRNEISNQTMQQPLMSPRLTPINTPATPGGTLSTSSAPTQIHSPALTSSQIQNSGNISSPLSSSQSSSTPVPLKSLEENINLNIKKLTLRSTSSTLCPTYSDRITKNKFRSIQNKNYRKLINYLYSNIYSFSISSADFIRLLSDTKFTPPPPPSPPPPSSQPIQPIQPMMTVPHLHTPLSSSAYSQPNQFSINSSTIHSGSGLGLSNPGLPSKILPNHLDAIHRKLLNKKNIIQEGDRMIDHTINQPNKADQPMEEKLPESNEKMTDNEDTEESEESEESEDSEEESEEGEEDTEMEDSENDKIINEYANKIEKEEEKRQEALDKFKLFQSFDEELNENEKKCFIELVLEQAVVAFDNYEHGRLSDGLMCSLVVYHSLKNRNQQNTSFSRVSEDLLSVIEPISDPVKLSMDPLSTPLSSRCNLILSSRLLFLFSTILQDTFNTLPSPSSLPSPPNILGPLSLQDDWNTYLSLSPVSFFFIFSQFSFPSPKFVENNNCPIIFYWNFFFFLHLFKNFN